jgi:cytosine/adenosine deaminase-related metal-dependent hydrolase
MPDLGSRPDREPSETILFRGVPPMGKPKTTAVRGKWVLAFQEGRPTILEDRYVVVEGSTIAGIARRKPAADRVIEAPEALVLPGLLNLHNHCISAVLFRGLTEDMESASYGTELVYRLLLPLGDLAQDKLTRAEMKAVVKLGLLEIVKGGTTTLMEVFRNRQVATFEAAQEMGLRVYAAPYVFSAHAAGVGSDGRPVYQAEDRGEADVARVRALFREHDGSADGRIRVAFAPHGADTCGPDTLLAVHRAADELGSLVTIHLSQSATEAETIRSRHGKSPTEYLESVGLLGPGLIAAHCVYATESDLARLKATDSTVVSCPLTFARGGMFAPFWRFASKGLRTTLATDGYCMDFVSEIRAAGFVSKLEAGKSGVATAADLIRAATLAGAAALRRHDLGRIAKGARADLVIADLSQPHFQPVSDPLRTFVWNGRGSDVWGVMVDGRMLVEKGRFRLGDEEEIVRAGARAVRKLWRSKEAEEIIARARGGT